MNANVQDAVRDAQFINLDLEPAERVNAAAEAAGHLAMLAAMKPLSRGARNLVEAVLRRSPRMSDGHEDYLVDVAARLERQADAIRREQDEAVRQIADFIEDVKHGQAPSINFVSPSKAKMVIEGIVDGIGAITDPQERSKATKALFDGLAAMIDESSPEIAQGVLTTAMKAMRQAGMDIELKHALENPPASVMARLIQDATAG